MKIEKNRVVEIHYTLKNDQGEIMDSSADRDPLAYIQGVGNLIPGLETELEGKEKGDKLDATIAPDQAYGERNEQLIHTVPKANFQGDGEIQPGMQVQVQTDQQTAVAVVTDVQESDVTLDLNHPLAGETLHFNVEVTNVREATEEELSHGHVHGPEGHQH